VRAPQGAKGRVCPTRTRHEECSARRIRELESGLAEQNIELRDGDTIFVPRAETPTSSAR
jgi:hypothetical protein